MNESDLALALKIAQALSDETTTTPTKNGRYCVVRGDRSGVFCGIVTSENGQVVEMSECRHIWYWAGASATDELAMRGVAKPDDCKFTAAADRVRILDAITVLDCTAAAEASLRGVPAWSQFK